MRQQKLDITNTIEQNVKAMLPAGEPILAVYEVVPLDYRVVDRETPTLYITPTTLLFLYDSIMEIYVLETLTIDIIGEKPKFNLISQLVEGNYMYSNYSDESLKKIKEAEFMSRVAINEPNLVPKEFILRKKDIVAKPFQTWAMGRKLLNIKNRLPEEKVLDEMLEGYFSLFNSKTILAFGIVSLSYLLLRWVLGGVSDIVGKIMDIAYGASVVLMSVWFYITINKNLKRFEAVYMNYIGYGTTSDQLRPPANLEPPTDSN
ncbi:MAG: hypothetical protein Fur003_5540 [Candidatus Dojkabacteria bacterium]